MRGDRAKAKYVAKDAYCLSSRAANTEERAYTSPVSTYTPTATVEKAKATPATVEVKHEVKGIAWSKLLFRVVLLAASAFLLYPLFRTLFSEFQSIEDARYSAFIVTSFLLLLITVSCALPSAKGGKSFMKRTKIVPLIIILLLTYELSAILGELFKWPMVCIYSFFVFAESVFLMSAVLKRNYRFIVYTVLLTILSSMALWRIIVI